MPLPQPTAPRRRAPRVPARAGAAAALAIGAATACAGRGAQPAASPRPVPRAAHAPPDTTTPTDSAAAHRGRGMTGHRSRHEIFPAPFGQFARFYRVRYVGVGCYVVP